MYQSKMSQRLLPLLLLTVMCCCNVVAELETKAKPLNSNDSTKYEDCGELMKVGYNVTGVHVLWMNATIPYLIECQFREGQAFAVIQRRLDGKTNFIQPYAAYMYGFGDAQADYWAGLNVINYLTTAQRHNLLTIHLQDERGSIVTISYQRFMVYPQYAGYKMVVEGYRGPPGLDDLAFHSGRKFATYDNPDEHHCATHMMAGWWYSYCAYALLNGKYYWPGKYYPTSGYYDGIFWRDWKGYDVSLKFVTMAVSTS